MVRVSTACFIVATVRLETAIEDTAISSFGLFSQEKGLFFGLIVYVSWLTRVLFLLYFIECPIILLYCQYRCT